MSRSGAGDRRSDHPTASGPGGVTRMRLAVLGGSSASPNTGAGCSGYLVRAGSTTLLIDPGPGTLQELRKHADFRTLSAVVVSHLHLDHTLDLLALRHALAYNPVPARGPVPVWLPPGGTEWLARAVAPFDACDEPGVFARTVDPCDYDPDAPLAVGPLTVRFAPAVHRLPTWAMRVEETVSGVALGYTADTGPSADLSLLTGVDLLLAEATLPDDDPTPADQRHSLTAEDAGRLATRVGAGRLVLTHLWEELGFERAMASARRAYAGPIDRARPGLAFEAGSETGND